MVKVRSRGQKYDDLAHCLPVRPVFFLLLNPLISCQSPQEIRQLIDSQQIRGLEIKMSALGV